MQELTDENEKIPHSGEIWEKYVERVNSVVTEYQTFMLERAKLMETTYQDTMNVKKERSTDDIHRAIRQTEYFIEKHQNSSCQD